MLKILPAFTSYSTTTEVVSVSSDGGSAYWDKCGGSCVFTYTATDENGRRYSFCSICAPSVGDFIRIAI